MQNSVYTQRGFEECYQDLEYINADIVLTLADNRMEGNDCLKIPKKREMLAEYYLKRRKVDFLEELMMKPFEPYSKDDKIAMLNFIKGKSEEIKNGLRDNIINLKKHPEFYRRSRNYKSYAESFFMGLFPFTGYGFYKCTDVTNNSLSIPGELSKFIVDACVKGASRLSAKKTLLILSSLFGLGASAIKYFYDKKKVNDVFERDLKMFDETRKSISAINLRASEELKKIIECYTKCNDERNNGIYCDVVVRCSGF